MIALIQRVASASVVVENTMISSIDQGLLVLLGVEKKDNADCLEKLAERLLKYRVFSDDAGKMNLNVLEIGGSVLMVPQFTLAADTSKGLRPGFSNAAEPEKGLALFTQLVDIMRSKGEQLTDNLPDNWLQTGQFGADMKVQLINDGPVTFKLSV